jgi:hypothetical protein
MSTKQGLSLVLIALVLAISSMPVAAEEGTVKATAAWQGQGRLFQVQEKLALFVGAFEGIMFVETQKGDLDAAKLLCPGLLEINLESGAQSGEGRCLLTGRSGDRVYAVWNCAGEHSDGCTGTFTLNGGTGKFQGITGSSKFQIRSDILEYVADMSEDSIEGNASGVAVWPALTYKIP